RVSMQTAPTTPKDQLMLDSISAKSVYDASAMRNDQAPAENQLTTKEAFQDFVAGTFYAQMLKSMHKSHGKPAYFHGGQAEDIFRSQLDQQIADTMARQHGQAF